MVGGPTLKLPSDLHMHALAHMHAQQPNKQQKMQRANTEKTAAQILDFMGKYTLFYMDVDMVVTTVTLVPQRQKWED